MAKNITLKWELPGPEHLLGGLKMVAQKINEKTNGQITIEVYGEGGVCSDPEIFQTVASGKLDMGYTGGGFGKSVGFAGIPRSEVGELPFWPSGEAGSAWVKALMDKYIMNDMLSLGVVPILYEINGCDFTGNFTGPYYAQVWCKRMYTSLADAAGVRIWAEHDTSAAALKMIGLTPVVLSTPQVPAALKNGSIDGVLMSPISCSRLFDLREIVSCCLKVDYQQSEDNFTIMNKKTYDSLPTDIRDIVIEEIRALFKGVDRPATTKVGWQIWDEQVKAGKVKIIELSPEEKAKCKQQWGKPMEDDWVSRQIAAGFKNARAYMEDIKKMRDDILAKGIPEYTGEVL